MIIIQARLNSQRFPGKVMRNLAGKPVLRHVIDRCKQSEAGDIVVATVEPADEIIELARQCDVRSHVTTKPAFDVVGRFAEVTKGSTETVVRVCADNPLILSDCITRVYLSIGLSDYCGYEYEGVPAIVRPNGLFPEALSVDAIRRANREVSVTSPAREHVTNHIYRNPREYRCVWIRTPAEYLGQCWSIDTPEDFTRVERKLCAMSS